MLAKALVALAASSLGLGSVAAARPAAPLSLANSPAVERAAGDLEDANQLQGAGRWIVGGIVLGLIIWGIIELTKSNERDFPTSP
jgi:hypothetical protein